MGSIFTAFLTQMLFTVGAILIFGFIVSLLNRIFYSNVGVLGRPITYLTGFIGTPIHECSHALFCLIFGHTINEIQLFQIGDEDGTLGYVSHSYNPRNFYHRIGNFFIGVAPIVVISFLLYLISTWLLPDLMPQIHAHTSTITVNDGLGDIIAKLFDGVKVFFSYIGESNWWWFMLIGLFLTLHMTLSPADIKGSFSGIVFVLLLFFIIDSILFVLGGQLLDSFTQKLVVLSSYLLTFFIMAFTILLAAVIVTTVIRIIFRR